MISIFFRLVKNKEIEKYWRDGFFILVAAGGVGGWKLKLADGDKKN